MIRSILLFALALSLAACTSVPPIKVQLFVPDPKNPIQKIAVVAPSAVETINTKISGDDRAIGLGGLLIVAAEQSIKTSGYNAAIAPFKPGLAPFFQEQIIHALTQAGYEIEIIPRKTKEPGFLTNYPEHTADAVLDFYIDISYSARNFNSSYNLESRMHAKLVDGKNGATLYESVLFPRVDGQSFQTVKALSDNASASIEDIKRSIGSMAENLGKNLGKR